MYSARGRRVGVFFELFTTFSMALLLKSRAAGSVPVNFLYHNYRFRTLTPSETKVIVPRVQVSEISTESFFMAATTSS